MEIVTLLIECMIAFVVGSAQAIGDGLTALFFTVDTAGVITGLSNPGIVIVTFVAIGFGVGLMRVIFGIVRR